MKKILLLLLITINCYSQKNKYNETFDDKKNLIKFENFIIEDKNVIWKMVFDGDSTQVIKSLRDNLKLNFSNANKGTVKDLSLNCKSISIQLGTNFTMDFRVDFKEGKYRVIATNFVFQSAMQFSTGMLSTDRKSYNIETYIIKKNTLTFRQNFQIKTDLKCMDELLTTLFTVKPEIANNDKW